MMISIRGTSGSGKTTLVRRVLERFGGVSTPHYVEGRKRPLYYEIVRKGRRRPLYVLGSYETACGGCDTISSVETVFELVQSLSQQGDVLYEGLLLAGDVRRTLELKPLKDVVPIFLDTPLEVCLAQVNARRREKDPNKEDVNPANTESKFKSMGSAYRRLQEGGVKPVQLKFDEALEHVCKKLGI